MQIEVIGGEMTAEEQQEYVKYIKEKSKRTDIAKVIIKLDGEYVDLEWHYQSQPFDRIRRITGYLVGTLDRFNDGKKAEVADRVPHGYDAEYYSHDVSGLLEER